MQKKILTGFRLTEDAMSLLDVLVLKLGVCRTAVLELIIREKADSLKEK